MAIDDNGGFQCTGLAIRYLYLATRGADFVNEYTQTYWDGTGKDFVSSVAPNFGLGRIGEHIDGQGSSARPRIGEILSEMASSHEPYTDAGSTAQKYGDVGIVESVSSTQLMLMVENNVPGGLNPISMHSATSWSINAKGMGSIVPPEVGA